MSFLICVLLSSLRYVRHRLFELSAGIHFLVAPSVLASIMLHIPVSRWLEFPGIFLLAAVGLRMITLLVDILHALYRNGLTTNKVKMNTIGDAITIEVQLARAWCHRPGQYIYLRLLTMQHFALLQSHPFYIGAIHGNTARLLMERREGLSGKLFRDLIRQQGQVFRGLVSGPYGHISSRDAYGTVILFALGSGIAVQVAYIHDVLVGRQKGRAKATRIVLYWEVISEGKNSSCCMTHVMLTAVNNFSRHRMVRKGDRGRLVARHGFCKSRKNYQGTPL